MSGDRFALAVAAIVLADAVADGAARAQTALGGHAHATSHSADESQSYESTDVLQPITSLLDGLNDPYLALKSELQNDADFQFAMPVSVFGQWGAPNGGSGVAELVYTPSATWTPFNDTAIGSGAFNFLFQSNVFWTRANTSSQQGSMGLLAPPNDWVADGYHFQRLTYTHTFPGNVLAVSVGQYSFAQFDGNPYAGNPQSSFINFALAQNGTQAYAAAGTGAYAQITPNSQLQVGGGFQGATDVGSQYLTTYGLQKGKIAYFLTSQWTSTILAGGSYSILYYCQPSVPAQSASQGISFSAAQNLNATYGLFLRVNNASGNVAPIETSVAFGGIMNDPFGRNRLDQAGVGVAWNKTNLSAVGFPARASETVFELYYRWTIRKAVQLTPDIQVYFNPALAPTTGVAAVFSLRTTFTF
jgi:hypothetical protein